jgi:peptidoglycan/LPS O-acetylase OafA/YrhL
MIAVYQLFILNVLNPSTLGLKFPEWSYNLTLPVLRNTMADWAIYFPLGLVYGLDSKNILPRLLRAKWVLVLLTLLFYIMALLSEVFRVINFPLSHFLSVTLFTLLIPTIQRNAIPFVRFFEKVGRRSYGLYLTHLITIDIIILLIQTAASWLFNITIVIIPMVFLLGLFIPLVLIELSAQGPTKRYHRIIFG